MEKLTGEQVLGLGFQRLPHFTVGGNLVYDLGRGRQLSLACVGTPNEMLFISCVEKDLTITDIVCLHNYDYDGALTLSKLSMLIQSLGRSSRNK